MKQNELQDKEAPQSVLLITDDADFRGRVVELWQAETKAPLVVFLPGDLAPSAEVEWCDVVVLGPVRPENLDHALAAAATAPAAVAFLPWNVSLQEAQLANPNVLPLHGSDDAAELAVMIGNTLLRRVAVERQLALAETAARSSSRHAALGRFMVESRHGFNNALTTVLGTAELLLLLDGSKLDAEQREQVRTVHSMAMKLYHMMVRFSALDAELKLADAQLHNATTPSFVRGMATTEVPQ